MTSTVSLGRVAAVTAALNGEHGLRIDGNGIQVVKNIVHSNSQANTNTYDEIQVNGGGCFVDENTVRRGATTAVQRYGIRMSATSNQRNILGNCNSVVSEAGVTAGTFG